MRKRPLKEPCLYFVGPTATSAPTPTLAQSPQRRHSRPTIAVRNGCSSGKTLELEDEDAPEPEAASPVPPGRINALLAVLDNKLYLYGGIREEGNKEVTFNDMWALNLNKLDAWQVCVLLGPGHFLVAIPPLQSFAQQLSIS